MSSTGCVLQYWPSILVSIYLGWAPVWDVKQDLFSMGTWVSFLHISLMSTQLLIWNSVYFLRSPIIFWTNINAPGDLLFLMQFHVFTVSFWMSQFCFLEKIDQIAL